MTSTAIVPGSLRAVAAANNQSLAESFLSADAVILVDVSGSMAQEDVGGEYAHQSRYQAACGELARVQRQLPGKVAIVSFSSAVAFCPGGQPSFDGGGTNLLDALRFVKPADGTGITIIVISDGEPETPDACLRLAQQFESVIDAIYIGPPGGNGAAFMRRLANAGGGQSAVAKVPELAQAIAGLLPMRG